MWPNVLFTQTRVGRVWVDYSAVHIAIFCRGFQRVNRKLKLRNPATVTGPLPSHSIWLGHAVIILEIASANTPQQMEPDCRAVGCGTRAPDDQGMKSQHHEELHTP